MSFKKAIVDDPWSTIGALLTAVAVCFKAASARFVIPQGLTDVMTLMLLFGGLLLILISWSLVKYLKSPKGKPLPSASLLLMGLGVISVVASVFMFLESEIPTYLEYIVYFILGFFVIKIIWDVAD